MISETTVPDKPLKKKEFKEDKQKQENPVYKT